MLGHTNSITGESQSIADATIANLTASKPVFSDANKKLVSTGTVPVDQGGTNITTYAVGDLLYASTTGVLSKLADVAVGQYLASGGVNTAPAWATLNQAAVAGLTTGSSPAFTAVSLGAGELTAGSINRASGSLTLEVGDAAQITATNALVTVAHDLCINETVYFDAAQTATGDGTTTIDWGLGNKFHFTHGEMGETFTFTAPGGPCNILMRITQDGVGGRDCTWPGTVIWLGSEPTWTDGGASKNIIVCGYYDGTNYWCQGTAWQT